VNVKLMNFLIIGIAAGTGAGLADAAEIPLIPRLALLGGGSGGAASSTVEVSPDGKYLTYLAEKDGALNVWLASTKEVGAAKPLTEDSHRGIANPPHWANDSKHILISQDHDGDGHYLYYSIDIATRRQVLLTPPDPAIRSSIVPDGFVRPKPSSIEIVTTQEGDTVSMYEVNVATGQRALIERSDQNYQIIYALDSQRRARLAFKHTSAGGLDLYVRRGKKWVFLSKWSPRNDIGVSDSQILGIEDDRTALLLTGFGRDKPALVRIDLTTGAQRVIAESRRESADSEVWIDSRDGTLQAYTTQYLTRKHVAVIPSIRGDIARLDAKLGPQYRLTSRSADDGIWIVDLDEPTKGMSTYLYDRKSGSIRKLFDGWPQLAHEALQPMHPIEIAARDGLVLPSYLTLPPGSDSNHDGRPDSPQPMVLYVHGGPNERDEYGFRYDVQWFANRGYAVLQVNFRGSTGFGKKFQDAGNGEIGGKMQDDLLDAVEWAIRERITQRGSIAIVGISYGGYAALSGITRTPDEFACGVDMVGPTDWRSIFNEPAAKSSRMTYELWKRLTGADPLTDEGKQTLGEISPLSHVNRITKPLLVMHGANDPAVSISQSDKLVAIMKETGLPVTYVVYPDEGHIFARRPNQLSWMAIVEVFLGQCLGGRSEPIENALDGSSAHIAVGGRYIPGLSQASQRQSSNRGHAD
jgi:dipeptidyl aminopeptidase/acylaminoacyl peptidase